MHLSVQTLPFEEPLEDTLSFLDDLGVESVDWRCDPEEYLDDPDAQSELLDTFDAYEMARAADEGTALVGEIMTEPAIQQHGSTAQSYAEELDERRQQLEPVLDREAEYELLKRAAWLLEDEFGTTVTVRRGEPGDELAASARPGKPAIHID